jgi:hypothetical protein
MFSSVQDFGRAYGTLTWNLSKVIPRKVGAVWEQGRGDYPGSSRTMCSVGRPGGRRLYSVRRTARP